MAPFYKTILALRKSNPALAFDAAYKKLVTTNDSTIFSYLREKDGHKLAVILNLSAKPQQFLIKDKSLNGMPLNVFSGKPENVDVNQAYSIEPWGYVVYDYR